MDELYSAAQEFMTEHWKLPRRVKSVREWVRNGKCMERSGDGDTIVITDRDRWQAGSE